VVILADLVDSFDELENIPTADNSVGICSQQIVSPFIVGLLHIFDSSFVSFEMNAVFIVSMLPDFDLSFLG